MSRRVGRWTAGPDNEAGNGRTSTTRATSPPAVGVLPSPPDWPSKVSPSQAWVVSAAAAARRQALLAGPVLPTLLRLALPTVAVLLVQTLVSVAETYFMSFLGTDTLAGVALVFPVLLLMTTMSAGGEGGGVASAVARARGADRAADADRLVLHALVLALGCGGLFSLGALWGGPALYRALGGAPGQASTRRGATPGWSSRGRC